MYGDRKKHEMAVTTSVEKERERQKHSLSTVWFWMLLFHSVLLLVVKDI